MPGDPAFVTIRARDFCIFMSTRRKFLLNCSAVAAVVSVTPASLFGAAPRFKEVPLEQVGLAAFLAHKNEVFIARLPSGVPVGLRLVEVKPGPSYPDSTPAPQDAGNEKFSLLFRGMPKHPLAQGTYWLERNGIGRFNLFLVPVGPPGGVHRFYEAVFNRPADGVLPQAGQGNIPLGRAQNQRRRRPGGDAGRE